MAKQALNGYVVNLIKLTSIPPFQCSPTSHLLDLALAKTGRRMACAPPFALELDQREVSPSCWYVAAYGGTGRGVKTVGNHAVTRAGDILSVAGRIKIENC